MARLPGLFQRGIVYQLRVMIPLDLQPAYDGRSKLIRSLDTCDWREAERKGAQARAALLEEFEERRRALRPQPPARVTPELGQTIGARIGVRLQQWDEQLRGDAKLSDTWLRFLDAFGYRTLTRLRQGPPAVPALPSPADLAGLARRSPFDGLTATQLSRLAELNGSTDDATTLQLASRSLSAVTTMADAEARKLGLLIDWRSPAARPVLLDCVRAYKAAQAELVKRDDGRDIETPAAPAKVVKAGPVRLRDVFERWKTLKKRSEDSIRACERALALFEERTANMPVQALARAQGDDFRSWLQTLGTSAKTAHDRLTWVKSLLVCAHRDLELIPRQPWEGIAIGHRSEQARKPWSDAELRAFFSLPLFVRRELPTTAKAGAEAAYWIPLLGLYTGARVGELCRLRVADVETGQDGAFLRIAEATAAETRRVPVHSELVRLGLFDLVASLTQAGALALWPRLPLRKGKPGAYFSDWVNAFHKEATANPQAPVFDELRHTVRAALLSAGVDRDTVARLVGRETGRPEAGKAITPVTDMELRAAVEALWFPAVKLRKILAR